MDIFKVFGILKVAVIFLHAVKATKNENTNDANIDINIDIDITDDISSIFPGNNYTY